MRLHSSRLIASDGIARNRSKHGRQTALLVSAAFPVGDHADMATDVDSADVVSGEALIDSIGMSGRPCHSRSRARWPSRLP